ncbi:hypothetical protein E1301_Tti018624 [Triplophysa tibetana]|uniref:Uncharacterized protein n=1 Tax=Triplophysa tibetana TaxID=1572043 RepID=A0A5A9NXK9_9TELE|nr:hypothetical protein E1301_Tti018624 [Triplophysa tibetana]
MYGRRGGVSCGEVSGLGTGEVWLSGVFERCVSSLRTDNKLIYSRGAQLDPPFVCPGSENKTTGRGTDTTSPHLDTQDCTRKPQRDYLHHFPNCTFNKLPSGGF